MAEHEANRDRGSEEDRNERKEDESRTPPHPDREKFPSDEATLVERGEGAHGEFADTASTLAEEPSSQAERGG